MGGGHSCGTGRAGDPSLAGPVFHGAAGFSVVDLRGGGRVRLRQGGGRSSPPVGISPAAGAFAMTAALIKPTAILLLVLPVLAIGWLRLREIAWIVLGAAAASAPGLCDPCRARRPRRIRQHDWRASAAICRPGNSSDAGGSVGGRRDDVNRRLSNCGCAGIAQPKPPRVRVLIGLTAFGLIHLLAQRQRLALPYLSAGSRDRVLGGMDFRLSLRMAGRRLPGHHGGDTLLARPGGPTRGAKLCAGRRRRGDAVRP